LGRDVNTGSTAQVDHLWIMSAAGDWNELVAGTQYFFTAPRSPSWTVLAECARADSPDLFFAEHAGLSRSAQRVCRTCDVRLDCLRTAMANGEDFGVWGGLSVRERRELARAGKRKGHGRAEYAG
jgi:WhiB family redox-sensing transcriptional regulator